MITRLFLHNKILQETVLHSAYQYLTMEQYVLNAIMLWNVLEVMRLK